MEGKTAKRFDGLVQTLRTHQVPKKAARFGALTFVIAMLVALIGNSVFPRIILGETGSASATRLWSSGAELNSTTLEGTLNAGTVSISSGTVRSGTYSYRVNPTSNNANFNKDFATSAQSAKFWFRFYLRIATTPSADTTIFSTSTGTDHKITIALSTSRTLQLVNSEDSANIGSASSALSTNTWYRIELFVDTTDAGDASANDEAELRLDGVSVASSTSQNLAAGISRIYWGSLANGTTDLFFDDIAINNSSGRSVNNWPGEGKIVHLRPNADGDNTAWTGANTDVDEVQPDDDTTDILGDANGELEDYDIDSAATPGISANDKVKLVQVGQRYIRCSGLGGPGFFPGATERLAGLFFDKAYAGQSCPMGGNNTNNTHRLRIKASSGGTVEESSNITDTNDTTWITNNNTTGNYELTLYDLPGSSTAPWKPSDLDTAQIGVNLVTADPATKVTTLWLLVEYVPASGGRIWSSGFELQDVSGPIEYTANIGTSPAVDTTNERSGAAALQTSATSATSGWEFDFADANTTADYYFRAYIRVATAPGTLTNIMEFYDSGNTAQASIRMNTDRTLELWNEEDGPTQVTPDSSAIALNTWVRLEMRLNTVPGGGSQILDARINGSSFASSSTINHDNGVMTIRAGVLTSTTADFSWDDVALNQAIGTNQNSWPGEGKIIHLRPSSDDGTNTAWTNGFANVDDVTPNDATDLVSETTSDDIDDYNIDDITLTGSDTVNLVSVGVRFNTSSATQEDFRVRLKDAAAGIAIESNTLSPASTTWTTNATAAPKLHPLTAYTRPEQDTAWTDTTLDSAQIGLRDVLSGTGTVQVTAVWLLVDYTEPQDINISGTCDQYDQTTDCTDDGANSIAVAVDGTLQGQSDATVDGAWQITGVSPPASGAIITVFINGETTASERAVAVTKYDGTGDITGIKLFHRHLTLGSDDNQTLSNADIDAYDNSVSGDADIYFDVSAGDDLTVDTGAAYTDERLFIVTGNTYRPASGGGGDVNTTHIEIDGTLTADSNAINVFGSWQNDGTFTAGTSNVTMTSTATGRTLSGTMTGSSAFYDLTFNGSGGTWSFSAASETDRDFIITNGTVTAPSGNLTVARNFTNDGGFTHNSGTVILDTTTTATVSSSTSGTIFNNFQSTAATKTIQFEKHTTGTPVFTFAGTFTITGTAGNLINLYSDTSATQWKAHFNSDQTTVTYVNLRDGGCDTGTANVYMDATSTSVSNNDTCWVWPINRLWSGGAELQSATAQVETNFNDGTVGISTTVKHGGLASWRVNTTNSAFNRYFVSTPTQGQYWYRTYFYTASTPGSEVSFLSFNGTVARMTVRMNTDRTIELWDQDGTATQIGSASSALALNTWYRIEVYIDNTTLDSTDAELRLNGTTVASSTTIDLDGAFDRIQFGILGAVSNDFYFDDMAVNGASSAVDNWPGEGKIVHMQPNAAGDNEQWTSNGDASDANCDAAADPNWQCVDEVTNGPDGDATRVESTTAGNIDDYNLESSSTAGIPSGATIRLVSVGTRFLTCLPGPACLGGSDSYRARIKATASGTVDESAAIGTQNGSSYNTNDDDTANLYPLTTYDKPGSTAAWTTTDLDSAQIGIDHEVDDQGYTFTTVWALVEYLPNPDISGIIYQTNESSALDCSTGGARTVRVKVDGTGDFTGDCTTSAGTYTVSEVAMAAGNSLTIYLDGETETAGTFTVATGNALSGIDLYQDRIATRCDNSCSLTNTDINDWDKDNDPDIHATVTTGNLTVDNDWKLLVKTDTFAPGGTVTTSPSGSNSYSGDVTVASGATLNMAANALSVGGSYDNDGTQTLSAGQTTTLTSRKTDETLSDGSGSFENLVLNDSTLLGYWKLDEGTGSTANDVSGYGHNGSLQTFPASPWEAGANAHYFGHNEGSLHFDGGSDYILVSDTADLSSITNEITISAWVKNDTNTASQWRRILSRSHTSCAAPFNDFALVTNAGASARNSFEVNVSGTQRVIDGTTTPTAGSWYHVAGTYDGTTMRLYVNGSQENSANWSGTINDAGTDINIGRLEACGNYFDGVIDDLRLYKRALSSTEISALSAGNHPDSVSTYTLQDNLDVNGNLTVRTGKLDVSGSNHSVNVAGNYLNVANLDARAGTFTFDASATGKTIQGDEKFFNLVFDNASGSWGPDKQILYAENITATNGTLTSNGTCYNSGVCEIHVLGNWTNNATYTANSGRVVFEGTASGKTISGTLNGSSAFFAVTVNGTGGAWTTQNPALITSTASSALLLNAGTLTVGNSNADDLEVRGGIQIAPNANETATLQTATLAEGSTVTIQVNQGTSTTCGGSDCVVLVGATSGSGQGNLKIAKNGILKLIPHSTSASTYVDVRSTGYFEVLGSQDDSGTSDGTTNETTLTDSGATWSTDEHVGKMIRMTSGLAKGNLYPITANTGTTLTRADTSADSTTISSVSGSEYTRKICTASSSIITANRTKAVRFIHDQTGTTGYFRVVYSTNNDAGCSGNDSFEVIADPDSFTALATSDTIKFSDGVRQGDGYEILDYGHVTAESGTSCNDGINGTRESHIIGRAGSEILLRYAEICSLGRNAGTAEGIHYLGNGDNTNEGLTVDKSRLRNNFYNVYLPTGSQSGTVTDSRIELTTTASSRGIYNVASGSHSFTGNRISGQDLTSTVYGIYITGGTSSTNITVSDNHIYQAGGNTLRSDGGAVGNTISNNYLYSGETTFFNAVHYFQITGNTIWNLGTNYAVHMNGSSTQNRVYSNTFVANGGLQTINLSSANNISVVGNGMYRNIGDAIESSTSGANVLVANNTINVSSAFGLDFFAGGTLRMAGNTISNSTFDAVAIGGTAAITVYSANDTFNTSGGFDYSYFSTGAHKSYLHNTTMGTANEVNTGVTTAGAFIISERHDGVAGATKIWGEYAVPADVTETPQTESTARFNYANNLWEDSFTPHGYQGSGTDDSNLNFAISTSFGGAANSYAYTVVCNQANCVTSPTNAWDVYRNGTLLTNKATTGSTYTDTQNDGGSAPNVQFKIDDAGTDFAVGDTFTFIAFKASADTSTQKQTTVMQDGDLITVASGRTIEFKGQGAGSNPSTFTRGGSGGWHIDIAGTIDAQYYTVSYLGGTSGGNGLDLQSSATVTNIADGTFNNFQNVGASDTYIKVHGDLIGTGTPSKTFANLIFTEASDNVPEYSVTETGGTPSAGNYWLFSAATCTGWTDCESSDSDAGDGGSDPEGFIHFTPVNTAPDAPTSLVQKRVTAGTTISTGGWTNETQVLFEATATDTDNPDTLQLCVEADILGTGFSNTEDLCGSGVAYSGSGVTVTVTITGLTDASEYHWQARVKDAAGEYSSWVSYPTPTPNAENERDFGIDTTACSTSTIYDGTVEDTDAAYNDGSLTSLSANWDAFSCGVSGLNKYEYSVGTTVGGTDIKTWTDNSTNDTVTATSLVLRTNQTYYVNVRAVDNANNTSSVASSDGQDVLPTISMSLSSNTITFAVLSGSNDRSDTETVTTTTSTNAYSGYVIRQYAGGLLTAGGNTIPMFSAGSYASPASWPAGACSGSTCGYGYTSDDTTIQGSNKFGSGTLYAPFATAAFGDIVADHTDNVDGSTGAVSGEQFTITHKVAVDTLQAAAVYTTTVYYIVTGIF